MATAAKCYVIVVGVDYSRPSELALERAFELASEKPCADVHVVHVLSMPMTLNPMEFGAIVPAYDPRWFDGANTTLREYSDRRLAGYLELAPDTVRLFQRVHAHVRFDSPAHELAALAEELDADLVVVGTHDRKGAMRLLLGSIAEQVVRLAPCGVLVVRERPVDDSVPQIEPACDQCMTVRRASGGAELWCEHHLTRHGARHHYHYTDRLGAGTNFPLIMPPR